MEPSNKQELWATWLSRYNIDRTTDNNRLLIYLSNITLIVDPTFSHVKFRHLGSCAILRVYKRATLPDDGIRQRALEAIGRMHIDPRFIRARGLQQHRHRFPRAAGESSIFAPFGIGNLQQLQHVLDVFHQLIDSSILHHLHRQSTATSIKNKSLREGGTATQVVWK